MRFWGPRVLRSKWRSLRGTAVLDRDAARQAGLLSDLFVSPTGEIEAIELQHGDGLLRKRIAARSISRLHTSAVAVAGWGEVQFHVPWVPNPDTASLEQRMGARVVGVSGKRVGRIADVHIDGTHMLVEAYQVGTPFWTVWRGGARILPTDIVSWDAEQVLVPDELAEALRSRRPFARKQPPTP